MTKQKQKQNKNKNKNEMTYRFTLFDLLYKYIKRISFNSNIPIPVIKQK